MFESAQSELAMKMYRYLLICSEAIRLTLDAIDALR